MYSIFYEERAKTENDRRERNTELFPAYNKSSVKELRHQLAQLHDQRVEKWIKQSRDGCLAGTFNKSMKEMVTNVTWKERNASKELGGARVSPQKYVTEQKRIQDVVEEHERLYLQRAPYECRPFIFRERDSDNDLSWSFKFQNTSDSKRGKAPKKKSSEKIDATYITSNAVQKSSSKPLSEAVLDMKWREVTPCLWMAKNFRVPAVHNDRGIGDTPGTKFWPDRYMEKRVASESRGRHPHKEMHRDFPKLHEIEKRPKTPKSYWRTKEDWANRLPAIPGL